jgi:hypothetical protein
VTEATNVAAAGAVMESDTTTASMSFVIDEDDLGSDLDTKVPTQQSVKAYVDAQVGGSLNLSLVSKAFVDSPYATSNGEVVIVDTSSGNVTVTLPAAASNANAWINVKKVTGDANTVIVDGNLSETIDGDLTQTLTLDQESLTVVCNGSAWYII